MGNLGVNKSLTSEIPVNGANAVRASNSICYLYGGQAFNATARGGNDGLAVQLMCCLRENAMGTATQKDGIGFSDKVSYEAGPFSVAVASGRTQYASGDMRQSNVGAAYGFKVARVMGHYVRDRLGALNARGLLVGATAPLGPVGQLRVSYSEYETDAAGNPTTKKVGAGYVHYLSKRTAVFDAVARATNGGGASFSMYGATTQADGKSTAYVAGLRHSFQIEGVLVKRNF